MNEFVKLLLDLGSKEILIQTVTTITYILRKYIHKRFSR